MRVRRGPGGEGGREEEERGEGRGGDGWENEQIIELSTMEGKGSKNPPVGGGDPSRYIYKKNFKFELRSGGGRWALKLFFFFFARVRLK